MKVIHIVGRQDNGKTTLVVELIREFTARGLKIGTLKHSSHEHELDKPGKDSYLHRTAGSNPAVIATKSQVAVFMTRSQDEDLLDRLSSVFENTDLVLLEGFINREGKKIEVWREGSGTRPLVHERDDIDIVVTDDPIKTEKKVLPRKNVSGLADYLCKAFNIDTRVKGRKWSN